MAPNLRRPVVAALVGAGPVTAPTWRRSSRCSDGACVEVATADVVHVRDSKQPDAGIPTFDHATWVDFLTWIREAT